MQKKDTTGPHKKKRTLAKFHKLPPAIPPHSQRINHDPISIRLHINQIIERIRDRKRSQTQKRPDLG